MMLYRSRGGKEFRVELLVEIEYDPDLPLKFTGGGTDGEHSGIEWVYLVEKPNLSTSMIPFLPDLISFDG